MTARNDEVGPEEPPISPEDAAAGALNVTTGNDHPLPEEAPVRAAALRIAEFAGVPAENHEEFCELVCGTVLTVWEWDRRALSSSPGPELRDAAEAARIFHQKLGTLNDDDRAWLEKLLAQTVPDEDTRKLLEDLKGHRVDLPWYGGGLRGLQSTAYRLAHLFAIAVGKSPPVGRGEGRERTVKDVAFQDFVRNLLLDADQTGGTLTLERAAGKGTLIDAIDLLAEHLPEGVVPARHDLPLGTLQRIKSRYRDFYTEADEAGHDVRPE